MAVGNQNTNETKVDKIYMTKTKISLSKEETIPYLRLIWQESNIDLF